MTRHSTQTPTIPHRLIWCEDVSCLSPLSLSDCHNQIQTMAERDLGMIKPFTVLTQPLDDRTIKFDVRLFRYRSGWLSGTLIASDQQHTRIDAQIGLDPGIYSWLAVILMVGLFFLIYAFAQQSPGASGMGLVIVGVMLSELLHGLNGTRRELRATFREMVRCSDDTPSG